MKVDIHIQTFIILNGFIDSNKRHSELKKKTHEVLRKGVVEKLRRREWEITCSKHNVQV